MEYTVSYAPHQEDIALADIFAGTKQGLYVDLAATHPFKDSITKNLYTKGWQGIDVAPTAEAQALFAFDRPRNTVIVGADTVGKTLNEMGKQVDLLIVGPGQADMLAGDWQRHKPQVVCIATGQDVSVLTKNGYERILQTPSASFFATKGFAYTPSPAAKNAVLDWRARQNIQRLEQENTVQQVQLAHMQKIANDHHEDVMAGKYKGLRYGLKVVVKGLRDTVVERATAKRHAKPHFAQPVADDADIQQLAGSYGHVSFTTVGPSGLSTGFFNVVWLGMRAVRKLAKMVLKRGRS